MKRRRKLKNIKFKILSIFSNWKKFFLILITLIFSSLILIFVIDFIISYSYKNKRYTLDDLDEIPHYKVAIVFGAGLYNAKPNPYLEDRIKTAVELYNENKIDKIIMSGDNRFENYNEPKAMIELALKLGIPQGALQPDYAGRRTYDTCIRAKKIFNINKAILITQDFHMTRALYTCNSLGIDAIGVTSDMNEYYNLKWYKFKDKLALIKAIWETKVDSPDNVVLGDTITL